MFHLGANFVAIAATADTDVPALTDGILRINNGHHIFPQPVDIVQMYASAVTLLRSKLVMPKTRQIVDPFLQPINTSLLPITDPNVVDLRKQPFNVRAREEVAFQSTDSAAGPNNHYILTWYRYSETVAPQGDIFTLRGTATTAAVASTWTEITMTWANQLPAGQYAVIGGFYIAANAIAFQCKFDGQDPRPGGLGGANAGVRAPWWQYKGGMGLWGMFQADLMPRVFVLNDGTDAVHTVLLDIVKVG